MAFAVVLDTCVLYPMHLRDSLLRIAERGLYQAYWSDDILAELRRSPDYEICKALAVVLIAERAHR